MGRHMSNRFVQAFAWCRYRKPTDSWTWFTKLVRSLRPDCAILISGMKQTCIRQDVMDHVRDSNMEVYTVGFADSIEWSEDATASCVDVACV